MCVGKKKLVYDFHHGNFSYDGFYRKKKDSKFYYYGYNYQGSLGNNTTTYIQTPREVQWVKPKGKDIMLITGGYTFNIIITKKKEVYTCGVNSNGQLGHGNTTRMIVPTLVQFLKGKKIINATCGYSTSIFMSKKAIYSCGYNGQGQCGIGSNAVCYTPTLVRMPKNVKIVDAGCGYYFTIYLSKKGKLYKSGKIYNETQMNVPTLLTPNFKDKVIAIGTGYQHLLVATKKKVYSMGYNGNQQLGQTNGNSNQFGEITTLANKGVVQLSSGFYHSIARTKKGDVYSWGQNSYGQLGNGTTQQSAVPVLASVKKVVHISGGGYHSQIVNNKGEVYQAGENGSYQMGNGNTQRLTTWAKNTYIDQVKKARGFSSGDDDDDDDDDDDYDDEDESDDEDGGGGMKETMDFLGRLDLLMKNINKYGNVTIDMAGKKINFFEALLGNSKYCKDFGKDSNTKVAIKIDEKINFNLEQLIKLFVGIKVKVDPGKLYDYYMLFTSLGMHKRAYIVCKRVMNVSNLGVLLYLWKKIYERYELEYMKSKGGKKKEKKKEKETFSEDDLSLDNYLNLDDEDEGESDDDGDDDDSFMKKPMSEQYKTPFALALFNTFKDREDEILEKKKLFRAFQAEGLIMKMKNHFEMPLKKHSEYMKHVMLLKNVKGFKSEYANDLKQLYVKKKWFNVTFKSNHGKMFNAHKEILLLKYNFFKDVLANVKQENRVIEVKEIHGELLQEVLNFAYLKEVKTKNLDVLFQLLEFSVKYLENKLRLKLLSKIKTISEKVVEQYNIFYFLRTYMKYFDNDEVIKDLVEHFADLGEMSKNEVYSIIDKAKTKKVIEALEKRISKLEEKLKMCHEKLSKK